jgi:hypothetical protein
MAVEGRFSFLTSGPTYAFDLPEDFDAVPDLSTPLSYGDLGGRSFDFVAASRDSGIQEEHKVLGSLTSPDGYEVEISERADKDPWQWYLRWRLPIGSVYTHIREEDGVAMATPTVESLRIVQDSGLPFLLPEGSLRRAVASRPGHQELASFFAPGREWAIEFKRPGYVPAGTVMRMPGSGAIFRAGASANIEVRVYAQTDNDGGRDLVDRVVGTLREA